MTRPQDSLDFEQSWCALRTEGEIIPSMSAFSPVRFKPFLPSISLTEIDENTGMHRIKLTGQRIRDLFEQDQRGLDINETVPLERRPDAIKRQADFHNRPIGRYSRREAIFQDGPRLEVHMTQLPLWGSNGERLLLNHWQAEAPPPALWNKGIVRFTTLEETEIPLG